MNGYAFILTCPGCGGAVEHVNAGVGCETQACAIVRCEPCDTEYSVAVHLRGLTPRKGPQPEPARPPRKVAERRQMAWSSTSGRGGAA